MILSIGAVLKAVELVGAATPAFEALFDSVMPLFNSKDQEELREVLKKARAKSDDMHKATQNL
jgi:capsule polysaccharide export protein KpsC/LpsZ